MKRIFLLLYCVFYTNVNFSQGISYNEEFQVNSYTQNDQWNPYVTGTSTGGFVVSWSSYGQFNQLWNGSFQIYDENGTKSGSEVAIKSDQSIAIESISALKDGGFIISYAKEGKGIFAQKYNLSSNKIGNEIEITTYSSSFGSSVATFANDGFAVCWRKLKEETEGQDIYCKVFDQNGGVIRNEFKVDIFNPCTSNFPNICSLGNAGFIVSWQTELENYSDVLIYFKIFDNLGNAITDEKMFSNISAPWHSTHRFSSLGSEKFAGVWEGSYTKGGSEYIYVQLFKSDGTKIGNIIEIEEKKFNEKHPTILGLANGEIIVCWDSFLQDGDGLGVFAQRLNSDGSKIGDVFQVNSFFYNYQEQPHLALFGDNKFVIIWQSRGQDEGREYGIFGKYFFNNPIIHELSDFDIITPSNDQTLNHANPTFVWNQATNIHINFSWELKYDLYIDQDEEFTNPQIISSIKDTIYQIDTLKSGQTYFWKVLARNYSGDQKWCLSTNRFYINPNATNIREQEDHAPNQFHLNQNYPNPFNPSTIIKFSIPQTSYVKLVIYDMLGKEVITLINEEKIYGNYEVVFDGSKLSSGVYFYRLQSGDFSETKKLILLR